MFRIGTNKKSSSSNNNNKRKVFEMNHFKPESVYLLRKVHTYTKSNDCIYKIYKYCFFIKFLLQTSSYVHVYVCIS